MCDIKHFEDNNMLLIRLHSMSLLNVSNALLLSEIIVSSKGLTLSRLLVFNPKVHLSIDEISQIVLPRISDNQFTHFKDSDPTKEGHVD